MMLQQCIQLLLLGVAYVNASPAWFNNKGFGNAAPSEVGCSSFTKGYDPYTGHITYRCNPGVKKTNYLPVPSRHVNGKESTQDKYLNSEALQSSGISRNSYTKPMYRSLNSQRSQIKKKSNKAKRPNNKRPTNNRRNRCPPGQMFQSELDICIEYPLAPPLPPRRPSNNRQTMFDRMLGDAPVRMAAAHQRAPASGTVLSVGKFNMKTRCKPNEILLSELDICVVINN